MLYIQLLYLKLSVFSDFLTFKFLLCGLFFNSNSFTHSIISLSLSTSLCHGSFLSSLNLYIFLHFWSYPFWVLLLHVSLSWKFHEGFFFVSVDMRLGLFLLSRCFLVCGNMNLGTLEYWVFWYVDCQFYICCENYDLFSLILWISSLFSYSCGPIFSDCNAENFKF